MIPIGAELPLAITWSQDDSSFYFATINVNSTTDESEWKDIIPYRLSLTCSIQRVTINSRNGLLFMTTHIVDIPFLISELLYVPRQDKLMFTSVLPIVEDAYAFQVYSINLKNILEMIILTTDPSIKQNLQSAVDRKRIMYEIYSIGTSEGSPNIIQQRLYSVDLTTGLVERWGKIGWRCLYSWTVRN